MLLMMEPSLTVAHGAADALDALVAQHHWPPPAFPPSISMTIDEDERAREETGLWGDDSFASPSPDGIDDALNDGFLDDDCMRYIDERVARDLRDEAVFYVGVAPGHEQPLRAASMAEHASGSEAGGFGPPAPALKSIIKTLKRIAPPLEAPPAPRKKSRPGPRGASGVPPRLRLF